MSVFSDAGIPWDEPPGHHRAYSKHLVDAQNGGGSRLLDFRISRYPVAGELDVHVHETQEQIYYVISGSGLLEFGDQKYVVGPGYTMFAPPGVPHGLRNTGDEDLVFVVVTTPLLDGDGPAAPLDDEK